MLDPRGSVWIKKEFQATTVWPESSDSMPRLEEEYKEAFAGKLCQAMEKAVDGKAYLVLGETKSYGTALWSIEIEDIYAFIPIIRKDGIVMPAGLSPLDQALWSAAESPGLDPNQIIKDFKNFLCRQDQEVSTS